MKIDFWIFELGRAVFLVILFIPMLAFLICLLIKKKRVSRDYKIVSIKKLTTGDCIAAYCNYLQKFE